MAAAVVRRGRSRSSSATGTAPPRLRVLLLLLLALALALMSQQGAHAALWGVSSSSPDSAREEAISSMQMEPVHLDFENIDCVLTLKDGRRKHLLKGVTGRAEPGRLLAILGPSGSGKTTLLNVLAGQVPASPNLALTGRLYLNGDIVNKGGAEQHSQAYVRQDDLFYPQLTVRETLLLAARLRLPASLSLKEKYEVVDALVKRMGLGKAADTIVGDEKVRGISGGEKKRLSLACELIGSPALIFADEPTSGLDAFQSEATLKSLKELARAGHTVVISIHQPRSSIFKMFDDVVLMSDGEVVYAGAAQSMTEHFAALGHPCPKNFNPAEFALDLVSVDYSSPESEAESRARVEKLLAAHRAKLPSLLASIKKRRASLLAVQTKAKAGTKDPSTTQVAIASKRGCGKIEQFRLLFKRSWRQITRSKAANIARAASNVFSAVIFGCLFYQLGTGQSSIQDRMGLLQVAAINSAMSSLIKTITVFIKERLIVTRERSSGKGSSYGPGPYFLSKLCAELPVTALFPVLFGSIMYPLAGLQMNPGRFLKFLGILIVESYAAAGFGMAVGTLVPSVDAGLAVAPAIMVLFIIMGGYYVNQKSVPVALQWIQHISMIKYAFEALCINEFEGLRFETDRAPSAASIATGEQVLRRLNFHESSVTKAVARQGALAGIAYLTTYVLLALRKPKFASVVDPEEEKKAEKGSSCSGGKSLSLPPVRPAVAVVRGGGSGGAWRVKGSGLPTVPRIFL